MMQIIMHILIGVLIGIVSWTILEDYLIHRSIQRDVNLAYSKLRLIDHNVRMLKYSQKKRKNKKLRHNITGRNE